MKVQIIYLEKITKAKQIKNSLQSYNKEKNNILIEREISLLNEENSKNKDIYYLSKS